MYYVVSNKKSEIVLIDTEIENAIHAFSNNPGGDLASFESYNELTTWLVGWLQMDVNDAYEDFGDDIEDDDDDIDNLDELGGEIQVAIDHLKQFAARYGLTEENISSWVENLFPDGVPTITAEDIKNFSKQGKTTLGELVSQFWVMLNEEIEKK